MTPQVDKLQPEGFVMEQSCDWFYKLYFELNVCCYVNFHVYFPFQTVHNNSTFKAKMAKNEGNLNTLILVPYVLVYV